jgi:hypothetical protein
VLQSDLIRSLAAGVSTVFPGAVARRTLEARWFGEGEPPAELVDWLEAVAGNVAPDAGRNDVYLASRRPDLNVKVRGGRLEVKHRPHDGRAVRFTDQAEGLVERWDKWVLPLPTATGLGTEERSGADWITVGKSRRLIRLKIGEFVSVAPAGSFPPRLCCFELTRLTVHGEPWWSVCLEASAPEDELDGTFLRAVDHVFSSHEPPPLDLAHSFGYPQWLMKVGT